jgi:hypothetical protein
LEQKKALAIAEAKFRWHGHRLDVWAERPRRD